MQTKKNSEYTDWSDGEEIIITSIDHLNRLIDEGYEIKSKQFEFKDNLGSRCTLLLEKEDKKVIANSNSIFEYWTNIVELYNFEKKRPLFV